MTRLALLRTAGSVLLAFVLSACGDSSPSASSNGAQSGATQPQPDALPGIVVAGASGQPGGVADVETRLSTAGKVIAGLQVDITLPAGLSIAPRPSGRPECTVNPDIIKFGSNFGFQPYGCASATACRTIRAVVTAADNVDPILDGTLLFTCRVRIAFDATAPLTLHLDNVVMSSPQGERIDGASSEAPFELNGPPLPTPTIGPPAPTTTATATPELPETPTPAIVVSDPSVALSQLVAAPASSAAIEARLYFAHGEAIAALQNDIELPPGARVVAKSNGRPDCRVNPEIVKPNSSFNFLPAQCAGTECTTVRALILSSGSADGVEDPIPNGALVYTCTVEVAADATGTLPLRCTNVVMSDRIGNRPGGETGIDGAITISDR